MKPLRLLNYIPAWSITVIVTIIITLLLLLPQPLPDDMYEIHWFDGADKVVHGLMFATLGAALMIDSRMSRRTASWTHSHLTAMIVIATVAATAYGAIMEIAQSLLEAGREGSWGDLAADAIGAIAGSWIFSLIRI